MQDKVTIYKKTFLKKYRFEKKLVLKTKHKKPLHFQITEFSKEKKRCHIGQ